VKLNTAYNLRTMSLNMLAVCLSLESIFTLATNDVRAETPNQVSLSCGPVCIQHAFNLLGVALPEKDIRSLEMESHGTVSMLQLRDFAVKHGLEADGFQLKDTDLKSVNFPWIVPYGTNHFVVIEGADDRNVYLMDPERGAIAESKDQFLSCWTTLRALVFLKSISKEKKLEVGPTIAVSGATFDFGTVSSGAVVRHSFRIDNHGKRPLVIFDVKKSCNCTSLTLSDRVIQPDGLATLEVEFDAGLRRGNQRVDVYLHTNDSANPYFTLSLDGKVIVGPTLVPGRIVYNRVSGMEDIIKNLYILDDRGLGTADIKIDNPFPFIVPDLKYYKVGGWNRIWVQLKLVASQLPDKDFQGEIRFRLNDAEQTELAAKIEGTIDGIPRANPPQVFVVKKREQTITRSIGISGCVEAISRIETSTPWIKARIHPSGTGHEQQVVVSLGESGESNGIVEGNLTVLFSGKTTAIKIPICMVQIDSAGPANDRSRQ
jgi:predicted double-glycine peptidase